MTISCRIILAAGGTGGHVFPAEALAEELLARDYKNVFLISDKRANDYKGTLAGLERFTIRSGTFGRGLLTKLTAVADVFIGIVQARKILKNLQPDVVVGFGGYPSFPTLYAASLLGIPTIIHEQNSVLGRANRLLVKKVNAIATSFKKTQLIEEKYQAKTYFTGNPVRAGIKAINEVNYSELAQEGIMRILVTGGSQGATIFSKIVPEAIAALPEAHKKRIRIDQQCRKEDVDFTRAAYQKLGISADIAAFFSDIPARLAAAHLVIARAGASTIAELTAAGRPSLLVPLPNSMDNHQYYNAIELETAGGAFMMPQDGFTALALSAKIESFLNLPEKLAKAAVSAKNCGKIQAASDLAALALNIAATRKIRNVLP